MNKKVAIENISKILPKTITIRVDIDTLVGLKKGIPKILDCFERHQTPSTFFCVMGPDTMGQHMKRLKKGDYWKRIWKVNPFKLVKNYGIKSFFYGTLLKSPRIAGDHPELINNVKMKGHEIICHGYNHAGWADDYEKYSSEQMRNELYRAFDTYEAVFGEKAHASGVPNWRTNYEAIKICEEYGFEYLADVRGDTPFIPFKDGETFSTIQLPITMPTTHELLQADIPREKVVDEILKDLNEGYNVFCIHDWFEGLYNMDFVEEFIVKAKKMGYRFVTMQEVAKKIKSEGIELPRNEVKNIPLMRGGVKLISHQMWI